MDLEGSPPSWLASSPKEENQTNSGRGGSNEGEVQRELILVSEPPRVHNIALTQKRL